MTVLTLVVFVGGLLLGLVGVVAKGLATDEVRGRVQRHARNIVEEALAAMPAEIAETWGDDMKSELESQISMPLSALRFAYGVRKTAGEFVAEPAPALAAGVGRDKAGASVRRASRRVVRAWDEYWEPWVRATERLLGLRRLPPMTQRVMMFGSFLVAAAVPVSLALGSVLPAIVLFVLVEITGTGMLLFERRR